MPQTPLRLQLQVLLIFILFANFAAQGLPKRDLSKGNMPKRRPRTATPQHALRTCHKKGGIHHTPLENPPPSKGEIDIWLVSRLPFGCCKRTLASLSKFC